MNIQAHDPWAGRTQVFCRERLTRQCSGFFNKKNIKNVVLYKRYLLCQRVKVTVLMPVLVSMFSIFYPRFVLMFLFVPVLERMLLCFYWLVWRCFSPGKDVFFDIFLVSLIVFCHVPVIERISFHAFKFFWITVLKTGLGECFWSVSPGKNGFMLFAFLFRIFLMCQS